MNFIINPSPACHTSPHDAQLTWSCQRNKFKEMMNRCTDDDIFSRNIAVYHYFSNFMPFCPLDCDATECKHTRAKRIRWINVIYFLWAIFLRCEDLVASAQSCNLQKLNLDSIAHSMGMRMQMVNAGHNTLLHLRTLNVCRKNRTLLHSHATWRECNRVSFQNDIKLWDFVFHPQFTHRNAFHILRTLLADQIRDYQCYSCLIQANQSEGKRAAFLEIQNQKHSDEHNSNENTESAPSVHRYE